VNPELVRGLCYIAASFFFVFGLKMLSSPTTARKGNIISSIGMLIAILTALTAMTEIKWIWIIAGAGIGSVVGILAAQLVKMTSMPQMVSLFNGFGGLASLLVGWSEFHGKWATNDAINLFTTVAIFLTILTGGVTFSGSLVAYGKLSGTITGRPVLYQGRNIINAIIMIMVVALGILFCMQKLDQLDTTGLRNIYILLTSIIMLTLVIGVLATIGIGGADMPVIICLLNSYSGLAACAAGFVINNNVLIVAGSLVGASGIILTNIMCKSMNRSLANVLFSGFGSATSTGSGAYQGEVKSLSVEDAYLILEAAHNVVFVPGYGMAAAQAQHVVYELGAILAENGAEVKYCIHPVAGRMPGHMNVLLAEANVPYELLVEPQDVNPTMEIVDVAVVIGANDVVNPAAKEDASSPLWGMPIIDVDHSRTCIVLKRSMNPGFAGVDNPLFFKENTRMLFGDAKTSIASLVSEFRS
jgi:NAD(P) transhydrogenase subunit beta